jgi:predicted ATP-dependent endonuclease of OLD family
MRLFDIKLKNFRGYREDTSILFDNLTAFIGKNDAGKSTVLDALNIVLADGKVDAADICVLAD